MNRHTKPKVSVASKREQASRAIWEIELDRLTPDRIEMLAARVYSRIMQPALFARMVAELTASVEHRRAREAQRGLGLA